MKILYLHGFASSGASGTAQLLAKLLPSAEVIAPDIPLPPVEALPMLRKLADDEAPDVIIGTSMGGMYAQQLRGHLRICVNPAFHMTSMSKVFRSGSRHKWLNGRKDGEKEFVITAEVVKEWRDMERHQFDDISPEEKDLCYGLFGMGDTTVNPVNAYNDFLKHYAHAQRYDGGHQLNEKALKGAVLPLLKQLLGAKLEEAMKEPLPDYMKWGNKG